LEEAPLSQYPAPLPIGSGGARIAGNDDESGHWIGVSPSGAHSASADPTLANTVTIRTLAGRLSR